MLRRRCTALYTVLFVLLRAREVLFQGSKRIDSSKLISTEALSLTLDLTHTLCADGPFGIRPRPDHFRTDAQTSSTLHSECVQVETDSRGEESLLLACMSELT